MKSKLKVGDLVMFNLECSDRKPLDLLLGMITKVEENENLLGEEDPIEYMYTVHFVDGTSSVEDDYTIEPMLQQYQNYIKGDMRWIAM